MGLSPLPNGWLAWLHHARPTAPVDQMRLALYLIAIVAFIALGLYDVTHGLVKIGAATILVGIANALFMTT